jgi:hypothetical protein
MSAALEGSEWSAARSGRTLHREKTRYPFYRRLGEPQGRSGRAENLVPTGIQSRTVQPIVSRYTDWATGSTCRKSNWVIIKKTNEKVTIIIEAQTHSLLISTLDGTGRPADIGLSWGKTLQFPLNRSTGGTLTVLTLWIKINPFLLLGLEPRVLYNMMCGWPCIVI